MSGFDAARSASDDAFGRRMRMECQICWTPYDPEEGDYIGRIAPGTAFSDLPPDWSCPGCNAPKDQFSHPVSDPEAAARAAAPLVAEFQVVLETKMRSVPIINTALRVEGFGFRMHHGRPVGLLVTPWFMSIVVLPGAQDDWSGLTPGTKEYLHFPTGAYEFLHNSRPGFGGYKACCLFSPMHEFSSQSEIHAVAEAVLLALFDPAQAPGQEARSLGSHALEAGWNTTDDPKGSRLGGS